MADPTPSGGVPRLHVNNMGGPPTSRRASQMGAGIGFLLAVLALCGAGVWGVLAETWKPISVAALCAVAGLVVGLFVDVAIDRHRGAR